jgi:hypothetical protein
LFEGVGDRLPELVPFEESVGTRLELTLGLVGKPDTELLLTVGTELVPFAAFGGEVGKLPA